MYQRKLGEEKAERILKAFQKDEQHFGFIKVEKAELSELKNIENLGTMTLYRDVFVFRAGIWVVLILVHAEWIDINLINPYDLNEHYNTSC